MFDISKGLWNDNGQSVFRLTTKITTFSTTVEYISILKTDLGFRARPASRKTVAPFDDTHCDSLALGLMASQIGRCVPLSARGLRTRSYA